MRRRDYVPRSSRKSPQEDRFDDGREDGRGKERGGREAGRVTLLLPPNNFLMFVRPMRKRMSLWQCAHDLTDGERERPFCLIHLLLALSPSRYGTTTLPFFMSHE